MNVTHRLLGCCCRQLRRSSAGAFMSRTVPILKHYLASKPFFALHETFSTVYPDKEVPDKKTLLISPVSLPMLVWFGLLFKWYTLYMSWITFPAKVNSRLYRFRRTLLYSAFKMPLFLCSNTLFFIYLFLYANTFSCHRILHIASVIFNFFSLNL
jgi:hypothetical protein